MKGPVHEFRARLVWTGAADGPTASYGAYSRRYRIEIDGKPPLEGSAAPPFRGDAALVNPEDMLVAALSACHCLSYLALAARSGVLVTAYEDDAWGRMTFRDGGLSFERVILRPRVTIDAASDPERASRLHAEAHDTCFIARSVAFPVEHEPKSLVASAPSPLKDT
jgi:organic hydroperoxide reductase OsmC/OhrA